MESSPPPSVPVKQAPSASYGKTELSLDRRRLAVHNNVVVDSNEGRYDVSVAAGATTLTKPRQASPGDSSRPDAKKFSGRMRDDLERVSFIGGVDAI